MEQLHWIMEDEMVKLNKRQAVTLLKQVATENPQHVADACKYSAPGKGRCIVGEVFHRVGVHDNTLRALDKVAESYKNHENIPDEEYWDVSTLDELDRCGRLAKFGIELTPAAVDVLREAQKLQDNGVPWGEAVERAL